MDDRRPPRAAPLTRLLTIAVCGAVALGVQASAGRTALARTEPPRPAPGQHGVGYRKLLHLGPEETIREVTFEAGEVSFTVAERDPKSELFADLEARVFLESRLLLEAEADGSRPPVIRPLPPPKPMGDLAEALSESAESPGKRIDWREFVFDTGDPTFHPSFSADGNVMAIARRASHDQPRGSVYVQVDRVPGHMESFEGLEQASLSEDGTLVFIETTDGLFVQRVEDFGQGDLRREFVDLGRAERMFRRVDKRTSDRKELCYFILEHQLHVELYSAHYDWVDGDSSDLVPMSIVPTDGFAIYSDYWHDLDCMLIVERRHVRLVRVSSDEKARSSPRDNYVVIFDHHLRGGEQVRSCTVERVPVKDGERTRLRLALGLRRDDEVRPTLRTSGSARFGVAVLEAELATHAEGRVGPEGDAQGPASDFARVLEPAWTASTRWNRRSPQTRFFADGRVLVAWTREDAWSLEVPR